jgi:hypothetical protein
LVELKLNEIKAKMDLRAVLTMLGGCMKLLCLILVLMGGVSSFAPSAEAQIAFSPTVFYSDFNDKDDNSTSNASSSSKNMLIDLRLGFMMLEGIYVGGIYSTEQGSGSSNGVDTLRDGKRYGPSIGLILSDFNFLIHYFVSADLGTKSGSTQNDYSDGSGLQFDAGWKFMLFDIVGIGPQLTYRNINYKKATQTTSTGSSVGTNTYNRSETEPRLAFWVTF